MSLDAIDVVRGRSIVRLPASPFRERAAAAARVIVDLGAGDGRLTYRLARAHPDWLCVAVDACAAAMRRLSSKAVRRAARGGAPNALFLLAAAESLPGALEGMADEITVQYPWGSLLRAVIEPDPAILRQIARVGRPGARLRVRLNVSAVRPAHGEAVAWMSRAEARLQAGYGTAGIRLDSCGLVRTEAETSWSARVHQGQPAAVVAIDGTIG
jgi:16S rRNA (adenine(1408)-N(1))-methyltransferase